MKALNARETTHLSVCVREVSSSREKPGDWSMDSRYTYIPDYKPLSFSSHIPGWITPQNFTDAVVFTEDFVSGDFRVCKGDIFHCTALAPNPRTIKIGTIVWRFDPGKEPFAWVRSEHIKAVGVSFSPLDGWGSDGKFAEGSPLVGEPNQSDIDWAKKEAGEIDVRAAHDKFREDHPAIHAWIRRLSNRITKLDKKSDVGLINQAIDRLIDLSETQKQCIDNIIIKMQALEAELSKGRHFVRTSDYPFPSGTFVYGDPNILKGPMPEIPAHVPDINWDTTYTTTADTSSKINKSEKL